MSDDTIRADVDVNLKFPMLTAETLIRHHISIEKKTLGIVLGFGLGVGIGLGLGLGLGFGLGASSSNSRRKPSAHLD